MKRRLEQRRNRRTPVGVGTKVRTIEEGIDWMRSVGKSGVKIYKYKEQFLESIYLVPYLSSRKGYKISNMSLKT